MQQLPPALAGLAAYPQFVLYDIRPSTIKPGKLVKLPVNHEGKKINAHDPQYWMDAANAFAWAAHLQGRYGVAFVLAAHDPFFFVDIDNCATGGGWSDLANVLLSALGGCAVEISQSGTGLHIIGRGAFPEHACKNVALNIELYTQERFVALTGTGALGNVDHVVASDTVQWLVSQYFKPTERVASADWDRGPVPEWDGPRDDNDLIRRACNAVSVRSAFSGGASFADLWTRNVDTLAVSYPPKDGDDGQYDESSADMALAMHLSFWTGRDCARMERLMRMSKLHRDKWDDRAEYLVDTITNAAETSRDVCRDKPVEPLRNATAPVTVTNAAPQPVAIAQSTPVRETVSTGARRVQGSVYLSPDHQSDLFAGCAYVVSAKRIWTPHNGLLERSQFKAVYGGFIFVMDQDNTKVSTDAWEVFTESRAMRFPVVDDQAFRPDLPTGEIISVGGEHRINTYVPPHVPMINGDVTPFLNHLRKLLPVEGDFLILLYYLAALVQHRGTKFRWAPVLQGVEGNGKTFVSVAATFAVGANYTHWPKASKLANQFNGWMYRKLLYCVEDFGPSRKRDEVMEELKPMITGENLEIEGKGVDQENREICGNFIFNTNWKGSVRKTRNDRRLAMLYTAQQHVDDLDRDGMTGKYMTELHDWAKGTGAWEQYGENYGFACIAYYLATLPIPDQMNPATGCQRAPATSSQDEAVQDSLGAVEQLILEAIEDEQTGFCGDFVSDTYLRNLCDDSGHQITPQRRPTIMKTLGFEPHPALAKGRTPRPVLPDAKRTVLYVRLGSPSHVLDRPEVIAATYEMMQKGSIA